MNYSDYQIETLVKQFRRIRGFWRILGTVPHPRGDPLSMSEEARTLGRAARANQAAGQQPRIPGQFLADPVDRARYPQVVELEMERRAASFMPEDTLPEDAEWQEDVPAQEG